MAYTLFTRARKTRLGLAVSLAAVVLVLVFKVSAVAVILGGAGGGVAWHLLMRHQGDARIPPGDM